MQVQESTSDLVREESSSQTTHSRNIEVVDKKEFIKRYLNFLEQTPNILQKQDGIVYQVSSQSGEEEATRIAKSKADILDSYKREVSEYAKIYKALPKKVAMVGGISHFESAAGLQNIREVEIKSFNVRDLEDLKYYNPCVITCYPSVLREILALKLKLKGLKLIRTGGERLFNTEIKNTYLQYSVPILEKFGSTEMQGIGYRLHQAGNRSSEIRLQRNRYSFKKNKNGWHDLIVKDNFKELFFPMDFYYRTGDEALFLNGVAVDFRRKNDPISAYLPLIEELFQKGCINIQIHSHLKNIAYTRNGELPSKITYRGVEFNLTRVQELSRQETSGKLRLIL